jgi:chromosome segregation ATPase
VIACLSHCLTKSLMVLAFHTAEERDALNKDPRRTQITKEIRDLEDAMEKLKRKIEDENAILESLKQTTDAQNSLLALQDQCEKDIDILEENVRDETYKLNKFDVAAPPSFPRDDDDEGDQLMQIFNSMKEVSKSKLTVAAGRLDGYNSDVHITEKVIAEKSAVLSGSQKALASLRTNLSSLTTSLRLVQKTVEDLREHESRLGLSLNANEEAPRELIKYIDARLDEIEEDDSSDVNVAKVSRTILKRLKKMVSVVDYQTRLDTTSYFPLRYSMIAG